MSNAQNSIYGSSVRSYKNLENASNKNQSPNFVKYIHTQQKIPLESSDKYEYTPIIVRNKSYDAFNSKILERPSRDGKQPIPPRFYQSIQNSSSQQKYINQISNLQNEITRLMANQLSIKTEKDLLVKENKRLKEEINYLNEKCNHLEQKNEELFRSHSKMTILEREYSRVLVEFEHFKSNCRIMHDPSSLEHITNLPTKVEPNYEPEEERIAQEYYKLKGKEVASRIIPPATSNKGSTKINPKVSWKRTSQAVSPIHKLDHYRKYSGNKFDDLSLIESKIDRCREDEAEDRERDYYADVKDQAKTIDLKDLEKIKEYDSNIRTLESEVKDLRTKNISLYKKGEEYQNQKMKLLETINELNYEKSRALSEQKVKQNDLKRQLEKIRLQIEEKQIKIIELNQIIVSRQESMKLLTLQKGELQQKIKKSLNKSEKQIKQFHEQSKSIIQLKQTLQKSQRQFAILKQKWMSVSKRQQQIEIQNKLHIHELQEKKAQIIELENQIEKLKQREQREKNLMLEEQSLLSKTENKVQADYKKSIQRREDSARSKSIQTDPDGNAAKAQEELIHLKQNHQRLTNEHNIWAYELNKLRSQNTFINDNYLKLTTLYEQSKQENQKLRELNTAWREIEAKTKTMKHLDSTVDHLWQIKEVQYGNLNAVLEKLGQSFH